MGYGTANTLDNLIATVKGIKVLYPNKQLAITLREFVGFAHS